MLMYLLDTDTVIYILKNHSIVTQNLQHHKYSPISICTITLMELYYGAYKSQRATANIAKVKRIEGLRIENWTVPSE